MFENLLLIGCAYLTAGYTMHLFNKASEKVDAFIKEWRYNAPLRQRIREIKKQNKKRMLDILRFNIADEYHFLTGKYISNAKLEAMALRAYAQMKDYEFFGRLNENLRENRIVI